MTYDAGALIAAERTDPRLWALHRRALERGLVPTVPAGVLDQGWRGGPQAQMSRLLEGCRIEPLDEARARSAADTARRCSCRRQARSTPPSPRVPAARLLPSRAESRFLIPRGPRSRSPLNERFPIDSLTITNGFIPR